MKIALNKKHKQYIALFISMVVLSLLVHNNFKINQINRINDISQNNITNEKQISPKELFLESWHIIKANYYSNNLNKQNWTRWKKRYINKIKTQEDAYVAINSMIASLDDSYSKFMSQREFSEQNSAINSKLYGIGVNIASISGKIYVINVLENAPAARCGIQSGDIILKVNNKDISGQSIYRIAQLIRGDINVNINLEILRGNKKLNKTVKREEIKVKTIESEKINDDIAYIRILSFIGLETSKEFIVALNKYKDSKGLILDLRGNSGGLFQNAIVISNLFMKKGVIVSVLARQGRKNVYKAQDKDCIYTKPLVILVDNRTASASEILTCALKENKRAVVVGTDTYGKGLVQKVFSLPNGTGMNLTIAHYLTPSGKDINKKGIKPDYSVNIKHGDFINNIDTQLVYAVNLLEKIISKKEN